MLGHDAVAIDDHVHRANPALVPRTLTHIVHVAQSRENLGLE